MFCPGIPWGALLSQILESAVRQDLIPKNPAAGTKRVKEGRTARTYLDSADQVEALLDAAGELDRKARGGQGKHVRRRASLAVLVFAGLRISEMLELRWRDVDLANGRLTVRESKTAAGERKVRIRGALREELALLSHERPLPAPSSAFVFPTATGARQLPENYRKRVLKPAVHLANKKREKEGLMPLPEGLTPHSLRRTYVSILCALGVNPRTAMTETGHADARLTLTVYAQEVDPDDEAAFAVLVEGSARDLTSPSGTRVAPEPEAEAA